MLSSDLSAVFRVSDPASRWVLPEPTFPSDLQRREKNHPSWKRGDFQKNTLWRAFSQRNPFADARGSKERKRDDFSFFAGHLSTSSW